MRRFCLPAFLGSALLLGCIASPPKSDRVDYLEGCWVDKSGSGEVALSLSLLPAEEEGWLAGNLREVGAPKDTRLSFARDGSTLKFGADTPDKLSRVSPPSIAIRPEVDLSRLAAYRRTAGSEWVVVQVTDYGAIIYLVHGDGTLGQTIFSGKKSSCGQSV